MNLINFYKFSKNEPFIKLSKSYYAASGGPGEAYEVLVMGNGHNKYIFTTGMCGKEIKFSVKEKHILKWVVGIQSSDERTDIYYNTVEFNALAKLIGTDNYTYLTTNGCDSYNYLNDIIKVVDISIKNKKQYMPLMYIDNENVYCDLILDPRQNNIERTLNKFGGPVDICDV